MNTLITIRKLIIAITIGFLLVYAFGLMSCTTIPKLSPSDPIPEGYVRSMLVSRDGKLHTFITDAGDTLVKPSVRKWIIGNCYYVSKN